MRKLPSLQRPHKEADATRSSQLSFELTTQQPPSDLISPPVIRNTVFDAAHNDPPGLSTEGKVQITRRDPVKGLKPVRSTKSKGTKSPRDGDYWYNRD